MTTSRPSTTRTTTQELRSRAPEEKLIFARTTSRPLTTRTTLQELRSRASVEKLRSEAEHPREKLRSSPAKHQISGRAIIRSKAICINRWVFTYIYIYTRYSLFIRTHVCQLVSTPSALYPCLPNGKPAEVHLLSTVSMPAKW